MRSLDRAWMIALLCLALVALSGGASSCRDAGPGESVPPAAHEGPSAAPSPASLGAVMRQIHFAFRRDGDAWTGGHTTYTARVDAGGLRVVPSAGSGAPGAGLVVVTEGVARGGTSLASRLAAPTLAGDATLHVDRGGAVEHLENTEDGVEQSWQLAAPPPGEGDLVVSLRASGEDFSGATATGLHFVDPVTRLGVRYGAATWVDARGARTPVAAAYDAGAIVLTVPAALVEGSAYPVVLDPTISPELGMDNPVGVPAPGAQGSPAVSFGGSSTLVVWQDMRYGQGAIFAARVSPAGTLLDSSGILVSNAGSCSNPAVAFDGTEWFVVWSVGGTNSIYGARVSSAGVVLDSTAVLIAKPLVTSTTYQFPSVGCGGGSCLVAFSSAGSGGTNPTVNTVTYNPSFGTVSQPAAWFPGWTTAVSYMAPNYLVVGATNALAQVGGRVFAGRTGPGVYDTTPITLCTSCDMGFTPKVTNDGTNWLVVHGAGQNNPGYVAKRVSAAGTVLDPNGAGGGTFPAGTFGVELDATYGGGLFSVLGCLTNGTNAVETRISSAGMTLGQTTLTGVTSTPVHVFDGAHFLLVSQVTNAGNSANPSDLYGARYTTAFTAVDNPAFVVSGQGANAQRSPSVAYNGTSWLAVWEDDRSSVTSGTDIWGARISSTGTVLDPSGIAVSQAVVSQTVPAVASNGTDWLVVWQDARANDIWGARVSAGGTVLDPAGFAVNGNPGLTSPAVASDGTSYLVVWQSTGNVGGARVSAGGTVLDPSGITFPTSAGQYPAVAFNGTSYLAAWTYSGDIWGARVSTAGALLDAAGFHVSPLAGQEDRASVASDGTSWLVAWQNTTGVAAARVDPSGAVLDPNGIAAPHAAGTETSPKLAWDGAAYWCVWVDTRSGNKDLYGSRFTSAGAFADSQGGVAVATSPADELAPAVAGGPATSAIVAYHRFDASDSATRARARIITDQGAGGTPCGTTLDCTSGFCVDGVCCDTACAGTCQACTSAKKGSGMDGTCGPIASGADPDSECAMQAASTCGTTGACNGSGACQLYASGTACGGACAGAVATSMVCDGAGTCMAGTGTDCTPYACSGGACKQSCANVADCAAGDVCVAGACTAPVADGGACTMGAACASGFCVDGTCCDTACTGLCSACSAAKKGQGADGTCGPIAAGTDPDSECAAQAASTCGQTGSCDGMGACARYAAGTTCAPAACNGVTQQAASQCDGAGTCQPGAATTCVPGYKCAGSACTTSCADDTSCAPGYTCDTTLQGCVPAPDGGGASSSSTSSSSSSTSGSGGTGGSGTSSSSTSSSSSSSTSGGGAGGGASGSPGSGSGCHFASDPSSGDPPIGLGALVALAALSGRRRRRARAGR